MTSSPPDIATLSLGSQQRLHDTYDYDGSSQPRAQFYNTSQGLNQSPYTPISASLGQSPLKSKSSIRSGLPSVCFAS
jgi:hypothetical protein